MSTFSPPSPRCISMISPPSDQSYGFLWSRLVWYTRYIRASGSHRCVGTLEAPTSYGNNRLCLRAVGARKLVEILIKGAIPLLPTDKYELHPQCSHSLASLLLLLPPSSPPPLLFFTVPTNENGKNVLCDICTLLMARQVCGFPRIKMMDLSPFRNQTLSLVSR